MNKKKPKTEESVNLSRLCAYPWVFHMFIHISSFCSTRNRSNQRFPFISSLPLSRLSRFLPLFLVNINRSNFSTLKSFYVLRSSSFSTSTSSYFCVYFTHISHLQAHQESIYATSLSASKQNRYIYRYTRSCQLTKQKQQKTICFSSIVGLKTTTKVVQ